MAERPPLGLIPEFVFEEDMQYERIVQLTDAISRYAIHEMPIPIEWGNELKKRTEQYRAMMLSKARL